MPAPAQQSWWQQEYNSVAGDVQSALTYAENGLSHLGGDAVTYGQQTFGALWNEAQSAMSSAYNATSHAVQQGANAIGGAAHQAWTDAMGALHTVKQKIFDFINWLDTQAGYALDFIVIAGGAILIGIAFASALGSRS